MAADESNSSDVDFRQSYWRWLKTFLMTACLLYLSLSLSDNAKPLVGEVGVEFRRILLHFFGGSSWFLPIAFIYHLSEKLFVPSHLRVEATVLACVGGLVVASDQFFGDGLSFRHVDISRRSDCSD